MNTKYPLNGRYASLGDIVEDYGKYSKMPLSMNDSSLIYNKVDTSVLGIEYKDTTSDTSYYAYYNRMPFIHLVYPAGASEQAKLPYELVWFDNVYSSTEKDTNNKTMKVIQESDSSIYGHGTPILVSAVLDFNNNSFPFRFVIADNIKSATTSRDKKWYYNYKTSDGEAVVMYAIRNIINIDKEKAKTLFFGDIDNSTNNTTSYSGEIKILVLVSPPVYIYYKSLFNKNLVNDTSIASSLFNLTLDSFELKNTAYNFLGDFLWTLLFVNYDNYAVRNNKAFISTSENAKRSSDQTEDEKQLKNLIKYIYNPDGKEDSYEYLEYLNNVVETKFNEASRVYFYCQLFLNSQRFYVSFVNQFRFELMTNHTYMKSDPVLRCDLGFVSAGTIVILSAVQTKESALPAGPLSLDTTITIKITYQVKTEEILDKGTRDTNIKLPLNFFSTNQINDDSAWCTLIAIPFIDNYVYASHNIIKNKDELYENREDTYVGAHLMGSEYFLKPFTNTELTDLDYLSDCSLGTLEWPSTVTLDLKSKYELDKAISSAGTYNNGQGCTDTMNSKAFTNSYKPNMVDIITNKRISPWGVLRYKITNKLSDSTPLEKEVAYIDVSILRCNNYYYEYIESSDSIINDIQLYYDASNPSYIKDSSVTINTFKHAVNDNTITYDKALFLLTSNVNSTGRNLWYYDEPPSEQVVSFNILAKDNSKAKCRVYASGSKTYNDASLSRYMKSTDIGSLEIYYSEYSSWSNVNKSTASSSIYYIASLLGDKINVKIKFYNDKLISTSSQSPILCRIRFNSDSYYTYFCIVGPKPTSEDNNLHINSNFNLKGILYDKMSDISDTNLCITDVSILTPDNTTTVQCTIKNPHLNIYDSSVTDPNSIVYVLYKHKDKLNGSYTTYIPQNGLIRDISLKNIDSSVYMRTSAIKYFISSDTNPISFTDNRTELINTSISGNIDDTVESISAYNPITDVSINGTVSLVDSQITEGFWVLSKLL